MSDNKDGAISPSEPKKLKMENHAGETGEPLESNEQQVYSTDLSLQEFGKWVVDSNGGYIDPSLILHKDADTGEISVRLKTSRSPPAEGRPKDPKKLVSTPTGLTFSVRSPPTLLPERFEESPDVTPHSRLCFRICSHILLGKESSFYQYFRQMPESFGTPLELGEDELRTLQGTNALAEVSSRKRRWMEEWETGAKIISEDGMSAQDYTWPLYLRAALIISSRAFPSKLLDDVQHDAQPALEVTEDSTPILIPLWDFLNHKLTPVTWLHNEKQLELLSNADISKWKPGEEVFNNYGAKGNEELLLSYGFCLEDSPSDYVSMKFKVPPLPPSKQELWQLLPSSRDWPAEDVFYLRKDESSSSSGDPRPLSDRWPDALLDVFRLLVCNEIEEAAWKQAVVHGGGGRFIFPTRLELAVASQLHRATSAKLAPILQAKEAMGLVNAETTQCKGVKAAIIYRDGQIAILQSLVTHLSDFLERHDLQNRMTFSKFCSSDEKFSRAITSHLEKSVEEFTSDEKDEAFVAVIADQYLRYICKSADPVLEPWWKGWIENMQRVYPFPWEEDRLDLAKSGGDLNEAPEDEAGDEAGEDVFMNMYEPLRTGEPSYFRWAASPGLCSWAFELMGISGIEIDGELVLTL